jgi:hypothetical protein
METRLLGLAGRKQAGKDTIANFLLRNSTELFGPGFKAEKINLADRLKELCMELFELTETQCYGTDEDKNTPTKLQSLNINKPGEFATAREVLQVFGTDCCRGLWPDVWLIQFQKRFRNAASDMVICCDARFPNEVRFLQALGGKVVRLTRDVCVDNHASETSLDTMKDSAFDLVLDNHHLTIDEANFVMVNKLREWGWL